MNVDELRAGLDHATEDMNDVGAAARAASVHQRIGRARRRRQAATAAGVAAVLAVVGTAVGLGSLDRDPDGDVLPAVEPNDPAAVSETPEVLAGERVESLLPPVVDDWDYVSGVESQPGADSLTITLPDDDHARVVGFVTDMWLTDVTLSVDGTVVRREDGSSISYPQYVDPGAHEIVLRAIKPQAKRLLGLAVYRRPDLSEPDLPLLVDGWSLQKATHGDDQAALTFTVPEAPFALAVQCWPAGGAGMGRIQLMGWDHYYGSGCHQYPEIEISGGDLWEIGQRDMARYGWVPGDEVTLQAEVSDYYAQRDDAYGRRMQALFASMEHGLVAGVYVRPED